MRIDTDVSAIRASQRFDSTVGVGHDAQQE